MPSASPTGELPSWSGRAEGYGPEPHLVGPLLWVRRGGGCGASLLDSGSEWGSLDQPLTPAASAGVVLEMQALAGPRPAESEPQGKAWRCVFMPSGRGLLTVLLEFENRYSGVAPG